MNLLGYEQYRGQVAGELSGGTRQKLNLTLALLHDPNVLLLDEPYQGPIWPRASGSPTAGRPTSSGTRLRSTAR